MTSSLNLKKIISIGAAALLAIGGSLATASPALAIGPTADSGYPPNFYGSSAPYYEADTLTVATNGWNAQIISASHSWYSCVSSTSTVTDTAACNPVNGGAQAAGSFQGATLATSYTLQHGDIGRWIKIAVTATSAGGASSPYIVTTSAAVVAAQTATFDPNGGVAGTTTTLVGHVIWLPSNMHGGSASLPTRTGCSFVGWGTSSTSTNPEMSMSAVMLMADTTYYAIWSGGSACREVAPPAAPVTRRLSPEQAKNAIKPLPVIVQPLVAALPLLSKPLVDAGGKVDLTAGDFTGLVSASISGKPLDLTVGATGGLTITVPNGKAGTTADLLLNFKSGTVILQDAIKYVAPVVVSAVPERSVSISAGSAKLSDASANQIRQAAFANMANTNIVCVAYAANGSAAAKAAALATAEQACALATKANPNLVAAPVTVIVNKAKAKTSAVGIKVYH
jgi:uncharacterized repeat protein (TIGR02543 family)